MSNTVKILIALGLLAFIIVMFIGVDALMCEPPCVQMKEMTEGERSMMRFRFCALGIYLLICFYDFLFTPIWWGLNRPDISEFMKIMATVEDPLIRQQLMIKLTGQHSPFTLLGGGLFHLTFLSILTASVWKK